MKKVIVGFIALVLFASCGSTNNETVSKDKNSKDKTKAETPRPAAAPTVKEEYEEM